jgi:hypothetical protein
MPYPSRDISITVTPSRHDGYLLQENGSYILLENGYKLLLDGGVPVGPTISRISSSYSLSTRN